MYARDNFYSKKFACYATNRYLCLKYGAMAYNVPSSKDGGRLTDSSLDKGIRKEKNGKIEEPNGVEFSVLMPGVQQHRA